MLLIGDIHGKWKEYGEILQKHQPDRSVQVGDFGWGFGQGRREVDQLIQNMMGAGAGNNQFIRGNHDDPEICRKSQFYIPDATYEPDTGIFFMGGALSIDQAYRTEGVTWWRDEELSLDELYQAIDLYEKARPRVVITHECPEDVVGYLFPWYRSEYPSRTRQALGSMWSLHKPEIHVFGHWHSWVDRTVQGTRFICLGELDVMDLDLKTLKVEYTR